MMSLKDIQLHFIRSIWHMYLKMPPTNSFYLRPLKQPKGNIWYYKIAAGRETLGNVFAQVMKSASFESITLIIHCEEHALLDFMTKVFLSSLFRKQLVIGLQMGFDVTNALLLP